MPQEDKKVEERREKIKAWFKNKDNLIFLGIIILAVVIRLYYFLITKNQPLWWDEADYMAYAKDIAGLGTHWMVTPQHNSIFPYIAAVFFKLGFSEVAIRFFIEIIPSILTIVVIYLICAKLFTDKKIAVISSILAIVFWEGLFNSMRFHLEALGLLLGYFAIYLLIKGYGEKEKIFNFIDSKWTIVIVSILVILTYALRRGFFLFGIFVFVYILFTKKFKDIVKNKYNWIALCLLIVIALFVEFFVFSSPITSVAGTYYGSVPFNLIPLSIFSYYFENISSSSLSILLYLFWLGFALILFNISLHVGRIKASEDTNLRGEILAAIVILVTLAYFLFYQRLDHIGDIRWYYPLLLAAFIAISKGTLFITDFVKKYSKIASIVLVILIVGYGGYYELQHADLIIRDKLTSFQGIKDVALYIKEVSPKDTLTVSVPVPQPAYYAEREFLNPHNWIMNITGITDRNNVTFDVFLKAIRENERIKYIIVTLSEPNHPPWMRTDYYTQNIQTGQSMLSRVDIPFMNTSIDFATGKQNIQKSISYGDITFNLVTIKEDALLYEIVHAQNNPSSQLMSF